ncbi:hypothetical protein [Tenacibaculum caenipelagi]|uniref:Uncharacterized protein n=1 Tax=Tenacibaculum caenipelagi TaxID=1325435 RepID=A0A4R6TF75_9FLAO|nr:hypothetical protein [Tenacibaculum caenipelagi]TDQ22752.1 hypothetical protein DFQ07_2770 [Tenacibaculum caenipelagi]
MQSLFQELQKTGMFTLDLSDINKCKGIVFLEVKPSKPTDKLVLNGNTDELITLDRPFKVETSFPIVNGLLTFKPFESDAKMKSIVRMLLVK